MPNDYEKFIGPDGVVMIGHSLSRRTPEAPTAQKAKQQQPKVTPKALQHAVPKGAAEQTRADSSSFAGRVRAILGLPEAQTRQRQALALAAETQCTPSEAGVILRSLPTDAEASFPHGGNLLPSSSVKLDAEGQRIMRILRSPAAEGREKAALGLALDTALPPEQVFAILGRTPQVAAAPREPTIAERAAMEAEFGPSSYEIGRRGSADIWKAAVEKANANMFAARGAAPEAAAAPPFDAPK